MGKIEKRQKRTDLAKRTNQIFLRTGKLKKDRFVKSVRKKGQLAALHSSAAGAEALSSANFLSFLVRVCALFPQFLLLLLPQEEKEKHWKVLKKNSRNFGPI